MLADRVRMCSNIKNKIALKDLPIGSKVKSIGSKYYEDDLVFTLIAKKHPTYPVNSATLITEKIICLKALDASEPYNLNRDRQRDGNNRYVYSNIRQWLNSDEYNWFTEKHSTDASPSRERVDKGYNAYDAEPGFLINLTSKFKNALLNTNLRVSMNEMDGSYIEGFSDLIFLLSSTEVGFGGEDGKVINYFNDNNKRICYPTVSAVKNSDYIHNDFTPDKPYNWRLRNPYIPLILPQYSYQVAYDGRFNTGVANRGFLGIRPALNISFSHVVLDKPDKDGCYILQL